MKRHTIAWTDSTGRQRADTLTADTLTAARQRLADLCPEFSRVHTARVSSFRRVIIDTPDGTIEGTTRADADLDGTFPVITTDGDLVLVQGWLLGVDDIDDQGPEPDLDQL